jgi:hypothetical protein
MERENMNLKCKYCRQIIYWQYRNGKWYAFDDMCNWYLHRCPEYEKRESMPYNRKIIFDAIGEGVRL